MGLSTHVLDTVKGTGAGFMRVDVLSHDGTLKTVLLDENGRGVLLEEAPEGEYQILFHAGAYWLGSVVDRFYDVIPVRFYVADAGAKYHIPLILSPFGYSTYRGG
jgi:5-hydroxyisourate hydrolase